MSFFPASDKAISFLSHIVSFRVGTIPVGHTVRYNSVGHSLTWNEIAHVRNSDVSSLAVYGLFVRDYELSQLHNVGIFFPTISAKKASKMALITYEFDYSSTFSEGIRK